MRHHNRISNYLVRSHHDTKIRVRDTNYNDVVFFSLLLLLLLSLFVQLLKQWFFCRRRCRCCRQTQLGFLYFVVVVLHSASQMTQSTAVVMRRI